MKGYASKLSEVNVSHNRQKSPHTGTTKKDITSRLNRIEGQIRGIKKLIDKDTYCDEVLNQISSVQSALRGLGVFLLECHLTYCIVNKIKKDDEKVIKEFMITISRLLN